MGLFCSIAGILGTVMDNVGYQFSMAEVGSMIEPDGILNDFRGKPVTLVKACRATHPAMIAQATLNLSVPC